MKTITETKQVYVPKDEEIKMYETIDGKKFTSEKEATEHEENYLKRKMIEDKYKMRKIDVEEYVLYYSDSLTSSKLYYIKELNDETKNDLILLYPYLKYEGCMINKIKSGWNFFIESEYDSNSLGRWCGYNLYIYNLEDVRKEKEEQLKKINEIL